MQNITNTNQVKGFTLIELLITVALITITVGVTTDIILTVTRSYNKTQITNEIEDNANFALSKLEKELRSAVSATIPSGSPNMLTFTDKTGKTITYLVQNNTIYRYENSGTQYPLTNESSRNGVNVTCPNNECFRRIGTEDPFTVKVTWNFTQRSSGTNAIFSGSYDVVNFFVVRGTY